MKLPSRDEINPIPGDLDGESAVRHFLGKTRTQIAGEFAEHGLQYQEALMFMGSRAFCFYFPAAVDYVVAGAGATADGDVVSCLLGVIEHRLQFDGAALREIQPEFVRFADHALAHYDELGLDPAIYGDLKPRLRAVRG